MMKDADKHMGASLLALYTELAQRENVAFYPNQEAASNAPDEELLAACIAAELRLSRQQDRPR